MLLPCCVRNVQIYLYIQRGLFERHKLLFALMLANKVLLSAGKVRAVDLDVFLKGGSALDINSVRKKPKVRHGWQGPWATASNTRALGATAVTPGHWGPQQ